MRVPFAGRIPRAVKRASGRTEAAQVPAHVRAVGIDLHQEGRAYIRKKLGTKLGKFALSIERVTVRLENTRRSRGGRNVCRIKVVLTGLPSIVYEERDSTLNEAIDGALDGVERAVRHGLNRRRANRRRRSSYP